jgi:hypothetical protein
LNVWFFATEQVEPVLVISLKNKNLDDPPEYMNETIKQAVATPSRALITKSPLGV